MSTGIISKLASDIQPFYVMEFLKHAQARQEHGKPVIHLSIGEPDFPIPGHIRNALIKATESSQTRYTHALGLDSLRQAVAGHYAKRYGLALDWRRVVITSGASAGLLYAALTLINREDRVGLLDPSYPCNKSFVLTAGGQVVEIPAGSTDNFQPAFQDLEREVEHGLAGLILASPNNPTGTLLDPAFLERTLDLIRRENRFLIMDEIYQELTYAGAPTSILQTPGALAPDLNLIVINSFSKYFGMTGLRLGWMVVPEALITPVERLAQNLAICPNTPAQHAALACFDQETLDVCELRRQEFDQRRLLLLKRLPEAGLSIQSNPQGAFYIYVPTPTDSWDYCLNLLGETGVCAIPGLDFSTRNGHTMMRLSYANSLDKLAQAMDLIQQFNEKQGFKR